MERDACAYNQDFMSSLQIGGEDLDTLSICQVKRNLCLLQFCVVLVYKATVTCHIHQILESHPVAFRSGMIYTAFNRRGDVLLTGIKGFNPQHTPLVFEDFFDHFYVPLQFLEHRFSGFPYSEFDGFDLITIFFERKGVLDIINSRGGHLGEEKRNVEICGSISADWEGTESGGRRQGNRRGRRQ